VSLLLLISYISDLRIIIKVILMEHILFKHPDKNNFMYSKKTVRVNRIRHYQWKKIMAGRYKN